MVGALARSSHQHNCPYGLLASSWSCELKGIWPGSMGIEAHGLYDPCVSVGPQRLYKRFRSHAWGGACVFRGIWSGIYFCQFIYYFLTFIQWVTNLSTSLSTIS